MHSESASWQRSAPSVLSCTPQGGDSSQKENKATPAPVSTKSSGSPAKKPTSPAKKTKQEDKAKAEASPAKPAAKKSKYFDGSSVKQERYAFKRDTVVLSADIKDTGQGPGGKLLYAERAAPA